MKRIGTAIMALLLSLAISNNVFAHSHLESSYPADGETITESLTEIVLTFEGKIEQGSSIEVTTASGQAVELQDLIIGEGTLTGTVAKPFVNDDYHVNWSIISGDGHPLEGEFSFTVNAPVTETEEEVTEEPSETPETVEDSTDEEKQVTEDQEKATTTDEGKKESSYTTVILIALLVIIVVGGLSLLMKKRK